MNASSIALGGQDLGLARERFVVARIDRQRLLEQRQRRGSLFLIGRAGRHFPPSPHGEIDRVGDLRAFRFLPFGFGKLIAQTRSPSKRTASSRSIPAINGKA